MRTPTLLRWLGLVWCACVAPSATAADARPATRPAGTVRVLLLSGGGEADRSTATFMRRVLARTDRFDVRVDEGAAGLTADAFRDVDTVVCTGAGPALGGASWRSISAFVEAGGGLVVMRPALETMAKDGIAWPGDPPPGPARDGSPKPTAFFDVALTATAHPITAGVEPTFRVADSLWPADPLPKGATVLATAGSKEAPIPVFAAAAAGKGRVVATSLGADLAALQDTRLLATLVRGVEWAGTGAVTLPPTIALPGEPDAGAVRTLLVTGGHDHEAAFYSLFDGYRDLAWTPVASADSAFKKDVRDKYDVLILYDFTRDLDEAAKKNLTAFVESGKGVVVLHHGLLSHQGWPWWYRDVVGGRYKLAPDSTGPASAAKEGQVLYVTPSPAHPITRGVAPFVLHDEAYKRLWVAPGVTPIVGADCPNSDATVAWVSPYDRSRVVYMQLGHGHGAFGHPSYRTLVHNAILWGAGRLK